MSAIITMYSYHGNYTLTLQITMKKNKSYFLELAVISIIISAVFYTMIDSIFVFIDAIYESPFKDNHLDRETPIIVISIFSGVFMIITFAIIDNKRRIQEGYKRNLTELFREFDGEKFQKTRNEVWRIKEKWDNKKDYKKHFLEYNFNDYDRKVDKELEAEISVIYELLDFYRVVSLYKVNKSFFRSLKYFYYDWWRSFLYDIGSEIESKRAKNDLVPEMENECIKDLSYIKNLEILDKVFGLENIPKDAMVHNIGNR